MAPTAVGQSAGPSRTGSPATIPADDLTAKERALVDAVNAIRAQAAVAPVAVDPALNAEAREWSRQLAKSGFRHSELDEQVGDAVCWRRLGQNIAQGDDVSAIVAAWLASPTHFANLVDPLFTHVGVSIVEDRSGVHFVTQEFMQAGVRGVDCPARN